MAKRWLSKKEVVSIELDKEGWTFKFFRIVWLDGSECIQGMKYVSKNGKETPYYPLQYFQLPIGISIDVFSKCLDAMKSDLLAEPF